MSGFPVAGVRGYGSPDARAIAHKLSQQEATKETKPVPRAESPPRGAPRASEQRFPHACRLWVWVCFGSFASSPGRRPRSADGLFSMRRTALRTLTPAGVVHLESWPPSGFDRLPLCGGGCEFHTLRIIHRFSFTASCFGWRRILRVSKNSVLL